MHASNGSGRRRGPRLRIHNPDRQSRFWELSEESPLSRVFELEFVPVKLVRASEATVTGYREGVTWWRRLTGDPPLGQITHQTTAQFARNLALANCGRRVPKRMSVMTQRKHCKNLNAIFRFCGPPEWKRKNLGLVPHPPWIDEPAAVLAPPGRDWTAEEVGQLIAAASRQRIPKFNGGPPPAWWRALLVVGYYTGLRIGTLLSLEWPHLQDGWLVVGAEHFKGGRQGRRIYLHPEAAAELEAIRAPRAQILPWPHCPRHFQTAFGWLLESLPEHRRFSFHALRRTHLTILRRCSAHLEQADRVAQQSAGHSDVRTTRGHYLNATDAELLLMAAIRAMPSPLGLGPCSRSG